VKNPAVVGIEHATFENSDVSYLTDISDLAN